MYCGCCRDDQSVSHLLKVEIVMEGPTYYIVFVDADEVPPPIRIDNLAEVGTMVILFMLILANLEGQTVTE